SGRQLPPEEECRPGAAKDPVEPIEALPSSSPGHRERRRRMTPRIVIIIALLVGIGSVTTLALLAPHQRTATSTLPPPQAVPRTPPRPSVTQAPSGPPTPQIEVRLPEASPDS